MQKICTLSLSVIPVVGLALITVASPGDAVETVKQSTGKAVAKKVVATPSKDASKMSSAGSGQALAKVQKESSDVGSVRAEAKNSGSKASSAAASHGGSANGATMKSATGSGPSMPPKAPSRSPAAKQATSTPAKPTAIAAKSVDSNEDSNRVAVLNLEGPKIFDIDADEVWKIRTSNPTPSQGELIQIVGILQNNLSASLSSRLGSSLVPQGEVAKAMMAATSSVGSVQNQLQAARHMHARYLVTGSVDRVEFDGNTVLPDVYSLTVSMQILDASTGQAVWSENAKKFTTKTYTKKSGKSVFQNFVDDQISDVSSYFSTRVAQVLGR
ncbi:MAG: hypothetical protein K2X93_27950 [Candidatus Obscuribacterales bacterium]|nr:hypothetical protein [Candidatus Obscuribacterales bacterium]